MGSVHTSDAVAVSGIRELKYWQADTEILNMSVCFGFNLNYTVGITLLNLN